MCSLSPDFADTSVLLKLSLKPGDKWLREVVKEMRLSKDVDRAMEELPKKKIASKVVFQCLKWNQIFQNMMVVNLFHFSRPGFLLCETSNNKKKWTCEIWYIS